MTRSSYTVTRCVTPIECWWLEKTVPVGTIVYRYTGPTYGAVRELAVTLDPNGGTPFFELPYNAVEER